MKKIILFAIGLLTSVTIYAENKIYTDEETGLKYQYDDAATEPRTATLIDGTNVTATKIDFIRPSFDVDGIGKFFVTSIGDEAFTTKLDNKYTGNTNIDYVIIPEGITSIGANAFNSCSNIKFLELPKTITTVDESAFTGCSRLVYVCCKRTDANINIPLPTNDLMTLFVPIDCAYDGENGYLKPEYSWKGKFGDRIYEGDMKVVYSRNENMTYVCATGTGKQAILVEGKRASDINVKATILGDDGIQYNVVNIGRSAFYGFSEIYTIKIAEGISAISNMAFQKCSNLRKLDLPSTINTIGINAFGDCNNLRHVSCKVADATKLDATRFPKKGMMALYALNNNYKNQGNWSSQFNGRIFIGGMESTTDENGLEYVYCSEENVATLYNGKDLPEVEVKSIINGIPVTGIDRGAFNGLTSIRKVTIPSSITAIGSNAFNGCSNLTIVDSKITSPFTIDTNVFSSKTKATLFVPSGYKNAYDSSTGWNFLDIEECESMTEFSSGGMDYVGWTLQNGTKNAKLIKGISTISNISKTANSYNVIAIGESAFSGIKSIGDLTIENGITRIEANAFKNCTGLTSITFPESNLTYIGASAFQGCSDLKIVTLPSSINTIGDKAFLGCNNLVEVECRMTIAPQITSTTFPNDDIILYIPSASSYYDSRGWNFPFVFLGSKVPVTSSDLTYVYGSEDPAERKEVILLSSSTTGDKPTILATVDTDKKVIAIAKNAFLNNTNLETLVIPEGVKYLGMYAFRKCSNLTTVTLPSTLKTIRDYAFDQCNNINKITSGIAWGDLFALEENVFSTSIVPTIYIPNGTEEENPYITLNGWKRFENSYRFGEAFICTTPDGVANMYYDFYNDNGIRTAVLSKIMGGESEITVPEKVTYLTNDYIVTAIGESLYKENLSNKSSLTKLIIKEGIKTIGAYAFQGCTGLYSVTLPNSLKTIGQYAFQGDNNINFTTIIIPNSVESIGAYAFQGCSNLKNITLSNKLTSVDEHAFANLTLLEVLDIPNTVETIGAYAFSGCTRLKIVLPSKLKTIGDRAFENNNATVKLDIPGGTENGVETIGMYAFYNLSNLKELILPSSLKKIDYYAFANCTNLTTITSKIKETDVFDIDDEVFPVSVRNAASLFVPIDEVLENQEESEISRTIAKYKSANGWKEFIKFVEGEKLQYYDNNTKLTYEYLTGPHTATLIGSKKEDEKDVVIDASFTITTDDVTETYHVTEIGESAFSVEKNPNSANIKTITISEGINKIGANAFKGCTGLTTINLPKELTSIGDNAFNGCTSLANVIVQLPASLETIGNSAFYGCSALKKMELPSTMETIGTSAFQSSGLQHIWLPNSLTEIGESAFASCSYLSNVWIERITPLNINENVFSITNGNTATLYVPKGKKASYNITGWNKFSNVVEGKFVDAYTDDVKKMTFSCYRTDDENNLPEAIITKSSTTSLEVKIDEDYIVPIAGSEETISYKVKSIGKFAFNTCTGLKSLELPSSLTSIGASAFGGCSAIREIVSDIDKDHLFPITDDVFHADAKSQATLYVPIGSKSTYEGKDFWSNFVHDHIEQGKWLETTTADENYLKYRYHTGKKKATVIEIVFPEDKTDLVIPSTFTITEGQYAGEYDIESIVPTSFKNKDKVKKLTIADAAEGKDGIKTIGPNSFNGCANIAELRLPETIETIGDYAFQNCSNLQRVWLPSKLTDIGSKAFNGCKSLNRVSTKALPNIENKDVFPVNIDYLFIPENSNVSGVPGWGSFHRTVKGEYIGDMTTAEEITYICMKNGEGEGTKRSAILWKSTNTPFSIESSVAYKGDSYEVTTIGEKVFSGKSFESLQLPNGITTIDAEAFKGCKSLKTLELPSTLKTIGANAFNGCTVLKQVELPSSLTSISKNAFDGCTNLTEVVCKITDAGIITGNPLSLPYATLYVANNKDSYKKDLGWEYLHILEGDRKLWDAKNGLYYAYSTGDKKAILIEAKTEEIDGNITIPSKITAKENELAVTCDVIAIDKSVFNGNTNVKTVKIEDGIQTIGAYAFQGCSNLKMIELPKSLTSIGEKAFDGCKNLTEVICNMEEESVIKSNPQSLPNATLYVHEETSGYYGEWKCAHIYEGTRQVVPQDGLYYAYTKGAGETIVVGADISAGENITIPGAITIGEGESAENYTVVAINDDAFSGNTDIKSVKIGEKIQTIGANAFQGCTNLQKVWLPSTLTKIGEKAFDGCNSIAYICTSSKIPLESPNFSKNVFSSYSATLFVPDNEAESNYKSKDFWKIFTMKVGYLVDVKSQDNLIYECVTNGDVATATLVKSETTVEDVTIPSIIKLDNDTHDYKVTTISKQVFKGNSNIVTLTIGENVKAIEDEAFMNCGKLQKVWLPSTLESIGNKAFNGSKSITRVSTKTKTMPSLGSEVFSTSTAYLFVPKGTESSWSGFAKVVEGHYVGDVTTDNISYICIENGDAAEKSAMLIKAPKTASTFASSVVLDSETYPLTTICESAFEDNTALVNLVIPDGVKAIEANAFKNSSKLLTVELPASLEKIGDNAFQGCGLVYIQNLAETPVTISENVFTDAVYNNATLYVPDNASENYDVEFWKKFTIVEGVYSEVSIEGMTYFCVTSQDKLVARVTKGLSKTKEVKIPAKIFIGGLNYQVLSVEKSAFEGYNTLEKVIVAEGIKSIGEAVFKECTNLKSVVLPASLEAIGDYAFESCAGLETVTCAGETPVNINKNVFSVTKLEVNVPTRSSVSAYKEHTIWGAFEILYSMSSTSGSDGTENVDVATYQLVTPEGNDVTTTSVAIVDDDNVKGDFVIPTTVTRNGTPYTVTTIAPSAFEGNIELISVSLPPTVTSIGTGAFAGCENLQSMTVNNTVPPTLISTSTVAGARRMFTRGADDSPIFKGVDVENCILYVPEESIEKYKASEIWGVFKNIRAISATGVSRVIVQDGTPFDVYNLQGRKVKSGVTTLKGLTPGVYIVKGKKVAIR